MWEVLLDIVPLVGTVIALLQGRFEQCLLLQPLLLSFFFLSLALFGLPVNGHHLPLLSPDSDLAFVLRLLQRRLLRVLSNDHLLHLLFKFRNDGFILQIVSRLP